MKQLCELKEGEPVFVFSKQKCRIFKCDYLTSFEGTGEFLFKNKELFDIIRIHIDCRTSTYYLPIRHSYEETEYGCLLTADIDYAIEKAQKYKKEMCAIINSSIKQLKNTQT